MDSMSTDRYGKTTAFRRPAFVPGILGALVLVGGTLWISVDSFTIILFIVAILAAIMAVFAWQAKLWWAVGVLGVIVIAWNPVFPFPFTGYLWLAAQFVAALAMVFVGIFIKVPVPAEQRR